MTLRLHPAPVGELPLTFLIACWLLDTWPGAVTSVLFGYDVPVPPGMYL